MLSFTAVSVAGVEYGPKAKKDYEPMYKFFDDNPSLVDFLSEEMLVSLLRDNFPGPPAFFQRTQAHRCWRISAIP